jgi:flagellar biosynthesis protein FlhG
VLPKDEGNGLLRRLLARVGYKEAAPQRAATVIAVASGKGGTGKSFLATSLAIVLAQRGRVVLVDCDYGLGSDHLLLGSSPSATLRDVIAGRVRAGDALLRTEYGPWLLAGGSGVSAMVEMSDGELSALAESLGELSHHADQLVLDLGAGISPQVVLTLLTAHHVVLVTNPDIAALTDAYALVKCLAHQSVRPLVSVVVNRVVAGQEPTGQRTFAKLADVSTRFSGYPLHYLGDIPDDPAVAQRRLGQPPLIASHPQCAVAAAVREIADRLSNLSGGLEPRPTAPAQELTARWRELIPKRRLRT